MVPVRWFIYTYVLTVSTTLIRCARTWKENSSGPCIVGSTRTRVQYRNQKKRYIQWKKTNSNMLWMSDSGNFYGIITAFSIILHARQTRQPWFRSNDYRVCLVIAIVSYHMDIAVVYCDTGGSVRASTTKNSGRNPYTVQHNQRYIRYNKCPPSPPAEVLFVQLYITNNKQKKPKWVTWTF